MGANINPLMNQKGFTVKELVMVLVVIGLLCAFSIPMFYKMQSEREKQKQIQNTAEPPTQTTPAPVQ